MIGVGEVYTPKELANFFIDRYNLVEKWVKKLLTIYDFSMGEGDLLFALIEKAMLKYDIKELPFHNLFGNEINTKSYKKVIDKLINVYHCPKTIKYNFTNFDYLFLENKEKYNIIFANPPYLNYNDLPSEYKNRIKELFLKYNLINSKKDVLLGSSRIDISALMINKAIYENLAYLGEGLFFIPMSLIFNSGANDNFRNFRINDLSYSVIDIFDFGKSGKSNFFNVNTRCGFFYCINNYETNYPINYYLVKDKFFNIEEKKINSDKKNNLFIMENKQEQNPIIDYTKNKLQIQKPRQGINTCGANDIFMFDVQKKISDKWILKNKYTENLITKSEYIYPLITNKNFKDKDNKNIYKAILLPYDKKGELIDLKDLEEELREYLLKHKDFLEKRKGVLINSQIKKGKWYALLGVGKYNFFNYKVVWRAYGVKKLEAMIFSGNWQANQSLHAYISTSSLEMAFDIMNYLNSEEVNDFLKRSSLEGTPSFAQPKKVMQLFNF